MNDLIAGLLNSQAYPHPAPAPRLIETHISWVILAGDYAYKLKKPVNLGFLDFSTLDKRRACCYAEIRLNRRLAPEIYLEVEPVTGTPETPRMGGDGPALEWAVKMRAFPADATLDREKEVTPEQIDAIAERIAKFHGEIEVAPASSRFGAPEDIVDPVAANFTHVRALLPAGGGKGASMSTLLDKLETWSLVEGKRLTPHFNARKTGGFIRECHGDLHLGNIAWIPDSLPPLGNGYGEEFTFDAPTEPGGIPPAPPFSKGGNNDYAVHQGGEVEGEGHGDLRMGNTTLIPNTLPPLEKGGGGGFVVATLAGSGEIPPSPPFPKGGINGMDESSGSHAEYVGTGRAGTPSKSPMNPLIFDAIEFNPDLRFIDVINEIAFLTMDLRHRGRGDLAWRCLNRYLEHTGDYAGLAALPYYQAYRAMVRAKVTAILASQHDGDFSECLSYLKLADRLAHERKPVLILMHGVSGSGKTWYSQRLLERLGAVRLRSDVERKRLFGLSALESSAGVPGGIYTREAGRRTLARLLELTRALLRAGFAVIVDATFIRRDWRDPFTALADELALPWFIAATEAEADVLRARLAQRMASDRDASEAGPDVLEAQLAAMEPFTETEHPRVLSLGSGLDRALSRIQAN